MKNKSLGIFQASLRFKFKGLNQRKLCLILKVSRGIVYSFKIVSVKKNKILMVITTPNCEQALANYLSIHSNPMPHSTGPISALTIEWNTFLD